MNRFSFVVVSAFASALAFAGPAKYLISGGGFYAGHSEVVLEKNVELFHETSGWFKIPAGNIVTLFAAGNDTAQDDISEIDPNFGDDEKLFSHLFADSNSPELMLRHNKLQGLAGGSNGPELTAQLKAAAASTSVTTPFRFYYTGHGAPTQGFFPPPANPAAGVIVPIGSVPNSYMVKYRDNYLALWNQTKMTAPEYTTLLDTFTADTPIQTVMVQCYSGGFAQLNFEKGDAGGNLSKANRCGFFATVPSRVAAGCSADINAREEYSPYFLAAVRGKTEKGVAVNADYDGNGTVTSDEGHAFVVLHENAIDVPISTSSQMLREKIESIPMVGAMAPYSWFEKRMDKVEKAIADGLARELGIDLTTASPSPIAAIRQKITETNKAWGEAKNLSGTASQVVSKILTPIARELRPDHPVFQIEYPARDEKDPVVLKAVAEARAALKAHKGFAQAFAAYKALLKSYEDATAVQHTMAKWERLGYLLETKTLEYALEAQNNAEWTQKYQQLKTCEHQTFFQ